MVPPRCTKGPYCPTDAPPLADTKAEKVDKNPVLESRSCDGLCALSITSAGPWYLLIFSVLFTKIINKAEASKNSSGWTLKQIFPNYRFVGICIQPYTDMVIQAQNILNLDLSDQYSFKNFEESSKSWVLTFLNKTIIIDQKSYIIDGFSNLFTNDVEKVLYSN